MTEAGWHVHAVDVAGKEDNDVYDKVEEMVVIPPVKAFAENHSVEGPVKDHPHAHQVLLALHLQTYSCKSAHFVLTK